MMDLVRRQARVADGKPWLMRQAQPTTARGPAGVGALPPHLFPVPPTDHTQHEELYDFLSSPDLTVPGQARGWLCRALVGDWANGLLSLSLPPTEGPCPSINLLNHAVMALHLTQSCAAGFSHVLRPPLPLPRSPTSNPGAWARLPRPTLAPTPTVTSARQEPRGPDGMGHADSALSKAAQPQRLSSPAMLAFLPSSATPCLPQAALHLLGAAAAALNLACTNAHAALAPLLSAAQIPAYAPQLDGTVGGACPGGGAYTLLDQCMAEQKYVRYAMARSLMYAQVRCPCCALLERWKAALRRACCPAPKCAARAVLHTRHSDVHGGSCAHKP